MPATAYRAAPVADALAIFRRRIERITKIQDQNHAADSHVVRVGQHLYVPKCMGDNLTDIESSAVFRDLFSAQAVALHVRNGNGERGQAIPLEQAMRDELEHLNEMIAQIETTAAA